MQETFSTQKRAIGIFGVLLIYCPFYANVVGKFDLITKESANPFK